MLMLPFLYVHKVVFEDCQVPCYATDCLFNPPICSNTVTTRPSFVDLLVRARSGLASLQLIEIPATNRHVTSVLIHAFGEVLHLTTARDILGGAAVASVAVHALIHRLGS